MTNFKSDKMDVCIFVAAETNYKFIVVKGFPGIISDFARSLHNIYGVMYEPP